MKFIHTRPVRHPWSFSNESLAHVSPYSFLSKVTPTSPSVLLLMPIMQTLTNLKLAVTNKKKNDDAGRSKEYLSHRQKLLHRCGSQAGSVRPLSVALCAFDRKMTLGLSFVFCFYELCREPTRIRNKNNCVSSWLQWSRRPSITLVSQLLKKEKDPKETVRFVLRWLQRVRRQITSSRRWRTGLISFQDRKKILSSNAQL